ncbi:alpha-(1-_3)-arabinofuranosyltransferase domain-containing protein [Streptomyces sp. WMMC1477]|uniref:alpha-(1->3)-arabinofuranosyltransferase domain-containing protein n=1 Tax=Streptomyces sp. WMMC1477 TaxID=3015155 RepID=UPI0022B6F3A8|nr:alpha-(1->3)-arabinofuranosyltransferase family protein [Streptomyces sp. WMMC1477]MCZ7431083.1 alpha-(1->3)-arabinofuranosyltransferase family protein [Streptomyces sp. WMMC1477]
MTTTTDRTLELSAVGPDPTGPPRSRWWLLGAYVLVLVAFVLAAPGNMTFETKLGVVRDPWMFLGELGSLWSDRSSFGGIADQYIGYLFPMLPFHAALSWLPVWLVERLWLALVVTTAFWGALRLAERFGVGTSATRLLGAATYALWPTFTIIVGSTSAGALPGAMLPWVLLPLVPRADGTAPIARVAAARSALLIPFMGGVNAASTLAALLPVGLYLITRTGRRRVSLLLWWTPGVILATLWWIIPLLLLGAYGEDFMPYVEQATATTSTMSAFEMLRGAGNWVAYLNFGEAWLPAGWMMATGLLAVAGSALAAAVGLGGLARRDMPERRWLVLTVVTVTLVMLAGYAGALGAPFAEGFQGWLDGWLKPFRNIYKFQPGLALALALGLAHLTAVLVARRRGARAAGKDRVGFLRSARLVPALTALLVLPGLALPYVTGAVLQPGAFEDLPKHWKNTANWLEENSGETRALVVPATAHGVYTWGSPIDQPLHVLADSPWAQRDYVPFGPPGERRMLDAVEQALLSGGAVPGLQQYLNRAGLHYVVVRNDLDPDQIGYVPPQTVKRTLESSGYEKTKGFGPLTTGGRIPADTPIMLQGFYPRQQSVEIYAPAGASAPSIPEQVRAQDVARTARVSGGPEALLPLSADPAFGDRPAVLTGDAHPGVDAPDLHVTADGLRRADTRFGLLNNNTSYTYTAEERNHPESLQDAGEEPKQILPVDGVRHQTVATLRGARSVTASSSGSWLFHLPQFDPVHAFDGDPMTGWAEGSADDSSGQWIRVEFTEETDIPGELELTPLPDDGLRPAPTRVEIETDRGEAVESTLRPGAGKQTVAAPEGPATWLKLSILDTEERRPGLTGAGFSEIAIPGVQVDRLLSLPDDAPEDNPARSEMVSLHRDADPGALRPVGDERALRRHFSTQAAGDYTFRATALPVPGTAFDELLDTVAPGTENRLTATAESTSPTGLSLSPRNLVDGDFTTAWIAGNDPVITLTWPVKRDVSSVVLSAAGGVSARPTEVTITSPDGAVTTAVDENGWARFETMNTDQLRITVTKTAELTVANPVAGDNLQLPVGLNEIYVPGLDEFRVKAPLKDSPFALECGEGPVVTVDGTTYRTSVSGTVRDLTDRRPVEVTLCGAEDGAIALDAGEHTVESPADQALAITDLSLARGDTGAGGTDRPVTTTDWDGDERSVEVETGNASYLRTHMAFNEGWEATLGGEKLEPVRLDGWQQGFLVPEGEGGTVKLEYGPATTYTVGLFAAGAALLGLLALALVRRRDVDEEAGAAPVPAPGWVLGALALTVVLALVAGPYALVVPAVAVLAWWRPGLLVPVAFGAMALAAVFALPSADSGFAEGTGAYGHAAQALALLALVAAVVTVPARRGPGGRHREHDGGDAGHTGYGHPVPAQGTVPPAQAPGGPARPGGRPGDTREGPA